MSPRFATAGWGRRWVLASLLLAGLGWLGTAQEPVFAVLTSCWQWLSRVAGVGHLLQGLQPATSHQVTTRSLPAMLTYGVLYIGLSLGLLRVLVRRASYWWQAVWFYAGCMALGTGLLLLGKLGGDVLLLYKAARQLIDFTVSPLPVLLVLVLSAPAVRRALAS